MTSDAAGRKDSNKDVMDGGISIELSEEVDSGYVPSYAREMSTQQLESYIDDIADTVRVGLDQSISILTPWFFNNMPTIYYQTTPRQEKVRHLSAIITGHVFETCLLYTSDAADE